MQVEVYINKYKIELKENTPFSYRKQWNKFDNIADRQASISNKFVAPLTPYNVKQFEMLGIVGNQSILPYIVNEAKLIVDSVPIVAKGIAYITGIKDGYEIVILDDNIHLFKKLGNKKLSELDLTSLNHSLTIDNWKNSFNNTHSDGFIYAIADFGNMIDEGISYLDKDAIIINYQLPSFFVRYIWDLIHTSNGFEADYRPSNDLIITPKRGYNNEEDAGSDSSVTANEDKTNLEWGWSVEINGNYELSPDQVSGYLEVVNGKITVTQGGTYDLDLDIDSHFGACVECEVDPQVTLHKTFVKRNGYIIFTTEATGAITTSITAEENDIISFGYEIEYDNGVGVEDMGDTYVIVSSLSYSLEATLYTVIGGAGLYVNVMEFIGEITQAQFIKDVMQLKALTSSKDKDSNVIEYQETRNILNGVIGIEDWSGRNIQVTDTSFRLSNYSKENRFAYTYINTDEPPFADGILDLNNRALSTIERTVITRPYNAPKLSEYRLNDKQITKCPFWEEVRDTDGNVTSWKPIKGKNYFGKVIIRDSEEITFKTSTSSKETETLDIPIFEFTNIDYQYFIDTYYAEIRTMLSRNEVVKGIIQMDLFYFDELSSFTLKYIKQLGGYFYLNDAKLTRKGVEVELIKVK